MTAMCRHGVRQPWECKDCLYEAHTPGPWSLSDDPIRKVIRGGGPRPRTICIIEDWTREADARLIAAAPDLYAALQPMQRAFVGDGREDQMTLLLTRKEYDAAKAAIAKAVSP